jgi:hypothetical protein
MAKISANGNLPKKGFLLFTLCNWWTVPGRLGQHIAHVWISSEIIANSERLQSH